MQTAHPRWLIAHVRSHPACRARVVDPDDLLGEVTLRLLQRRRYPNVDRQSVRWALADSLRYLRRHGRDVVTPPEQLAREAPAEDAPAEAVRRLRRARRLATAFEALPTPQREVARLRVLGGLTERQISSRVGLSTATVHRRYVAARRTLVAALEDPEP